MTLYYTQCPSERNYDSVVENLYEIMKSLNIYCPQCEEHIVAPHDKVYVSLAEKCIMCTDTEKEIEEISSTAFRIMAR